MLRFAAWHAADHDDTALREHVSEQLCLVAADAVEGDRRDLEPTASDLLEAARSLAFGTSPLTPRSVAAFAHHVARLADAWPTAAARYRPLVQGLCESLPAPLARELWPLLIRLRAS